MSSSPAQCFAFAQNPWARISDFRLQHLVPLAVANAATLVVSHHGPLGVLWAQAKVLGPCEIFGGNFAYGLTGPRLMDIR
jgi:hypothetical protein